MGRGGGLGLRPAPTSPFNPSEHVRQRLAHLVIREPQNPKTAPAQDTISLGVEFDLLTTTSTDTIRTYLFSAYDGGGSTAWQGTTGITSSLMYGPAYWYGIGFAASGHPNVIPSIPFGKVLLRPTMFGDTDLDDTTNDADLSAENAGGSTWADGD